MPFTSTDYVGPSPAGGYGDFYIDPATGMKVGVSYPTQGEAERAYNERHGLPNEPLGAPAGPGGAPPSPGMYPGIVDTRIDMDYKQALLGLQQAQIDYNNARMRMVEVPGMEAERAYKEALTRLQEARDKHDQLKFKIETQMDIWKTRGEQEGRYGMFDPSDRMPMLPPGYGDRDVELEREPADVARITDWGAKVKATTGKLPTRDQYTQRWGQAGGQLVDWARYLGTGDPTKLLASGYPGLDKGGLPQAEQQVRDIWDWGTREKQARGGRLPSREEYAQRWGDRGGALYDAAMRTGTADVDQFLEQNRGNRDLMGGFSSQYGTNWNSSTAGSIPGAGNQPPTYPPPSSRPQPTGDDMFEDEEPDWKDIVAGRKKKPRQPLDTDRLFASQRGF